MSAELSQQEAPDADLVGSVHSFGADGPAYEVIALDRNDDVMVRVVETGETFTYPVASVRNDPEA